MLNLLWKSPFVWNPWRSMELIRSGEDPENDIFFQKDFPNLDGIPVAAYPIVLVHGFIGWGRDEPVIPTPLGGLRYWGGFTHDIEQYLRGQGLTVATASVGPISSIWDRACELYAQLVGSQVDYGYGHAQKFHHQRLGKKYEQPLIPGWEQEENRARHKLNLITHSMGGLTARLLIHLLENGSPEEEHAHREQFGHLEGLSPLFKTGQPKHWVRSLITLSTPHDGTTLLEALTRIESDGTRHPQAFLAVLAALSDYCALPPFSYYDFNLDQWLQTAATAGQPRQIPSRDLTLKAIKDFQTNFNGSATPAL